MKDTEEIDVSDISVRYSSCTQSGVLHDILCHDRYEILYITGGSGRYISEGVGLPIDPGALFIAHPFEYRTTEIDDGASYCCYTIRFLPTGLSDTSRKMLEQMTATDSSMYYAPGSVSSSVDAVFDRFYVAASLPEREKRAFVEAVLSELIILLSAAVGDNSYSSEDNLTTRVTGYINSNLQRDLSLDALARRFFVNKYYLCRTFKSQSGISIHNYINRKRVLYAKQLIDSGETASRAAYRVGFGDYSAFYRAYMKIYGVSPTSGERGGGF